MREGAVGFGHLVHIVTALDRKTHTVRGVEDFHCQTLCHGLLTTTTGEADEPTDGKCGGTARTDFDRHLVRGTADTTTLDLERRTDVVDCALQDREGVATGLLRNDVKGTVDNALGKAALAAAEDFVDDLRDEDRAVNRVWQEITTGCRTFTGHY